MTIDKAIELLKAINVQRGTLSEDDIKAIQLGIEALKYAKTSRDPSGNPAYSLLPGETLVSLSNEEKRRTQ